MPHHDDLSPGAAVPAPGLLILTGASHTGKTTVARAILAAVEPPAAFLGVDDVLATSLARPPEDRWAEIPLAYDLLVPQLEALLDRDWFVVVESTFTYVPTHGPPEFHDGPLLRLIETAERRQAPWLLTQLAAADGVPRLRSSQTSRLAPEVVARTEELHREAALPASTLRLNSADAAPDHLARQILAALAELAAA